MGFNLWVLRAERLPVAYPNDSSVHLQMVTFAGHLLSSGQFPLDHWYPYLSLGSPFFVQYQSASAILTGALGQVVGAQQAFSWTLYLLLSLWPVCIYFSGRLLGLGSVDVGSFGGDLTTVVQHHGLRLRGPELRGYRERRVVPTLGDVDTSLGVGL